jgi:hypothetical protein
VVQSSTVRPLMEARPSESGIPIPLRRRAAERCVGRSDQPVAVVADPQAIGIELMRLLRTVTEDALILRSLHTRCEGDPSRALARAQAHTVDLYDTSARALETAEDLLRASRSAHVFSDGAS